jgi:excisionase family DNA binding protein
MLISNLRRLKCPKCGCNADIHGEGNVSHQSYESNTVGKEVEPSEVQDNTYPEILRVEHVAEIIGVSKRVAYEIMEYKGFPLIRIRRSKRVNREDFFRWLKDRNQ